jgi:hypothetical protein
MLNGRVLATVQVMRSPLIADEFTFDRQFDRQSVNLREVA